MADDHNQQAYRVGEASPRGQGGGSGNDPLAELARLIGQSDPFGEYGRNNNGNRNAAAPVDQSWPGEAAAQPNEQPKLPNQSAYQEQPYGTPGFGRQAFGSAPLSTDSTEFYPVDAHAPGYRSQGYDQADYQQHGSVPGYEDAFPPSQEPLHDVHQQFGPAASDDYYDDVAPSRRRLGVTAIAGIFALAVVGTAAALGYRAVFGPSSAPTNPPVIKADNAPSKIVPATPNRDAGKTITDRVGNSGNGQIEKLLSREEQPVPVTTATNTPANANPPALGSGVVGDPKKIRTIAIRPDQGGDSAAAEVAPTPAAVSAAEPTPRPLTVTPRPIATTAERPAPQAQRPIAAAQPAPAAAPVAPAPAPAPRQAANAPLSLNPNAAPAPARQERVAATTPAAPAPAPASTSGGYAVQVSAQRSEAEAQAAFRALQGKFPDQLGGRQPVIRRADLGAKGIYYRAMVVVGSNSEAGELCSSLKAAGGSCIIQRN